MTNKHFDPYHRWLGIPPKHQPPDYYRLLALERFEDDEEVIRDAAEQRIAHVRNYRLGEHAELAHQLLKELGRAKACLLDERKRAEYDECLHAEEQFVNAQKAGGAFPGWENETHRESDVGAASSQSDDDEQTDIVTEVVDVCPTITDGKHTSGIRRKLAKSKQAAEELRATAVEWTRHMLSTQKGRLLATYICMFVVIVILVFALVLLLLSKAS